MPRQLTIFFPDGRTEYWLTAQVFVVGDRLDRNGGAWVITSITSPNGQESDTQDGDGRHATITLRPHDNGNPT
ncbi:MAG TPA: hypothetical protein VJM07_11255 [Gaiella sp.]|jgi:hypothetical protein|nr:hypothetical protein [Gaiella sp.]